MHTPQGKSEFVRLLNYEEGPKFRDSSPTGKINSRRISEVKQASGARLDKIMNKFRSQKKNVDLFHL